MKPDLAAIVAEMRDFANGHFSAEPNDLGDWADRIESAMAQEREGWDADEFTAMAKFIDGVMDQWWDGDLDGGSRQDMAEACGLLVQVTVTEPCGEVCNCVEYGDDFPTNCLRPTPLLRKITKAAAPTGGSET